MPLIHLTTEINAPIQVVFDLARDIDFHQEAASKTREKAIAGRTSGLIELGESVVWEAIHFGIKQKLSTKITAMNAPHSFRDEMLFGAFKSIKHEHFFYLDSAWYDGFSPQGRKDAVMNVGQKDPVLNESRKDVVMNEGQKDAVLDQGQKGAILDKVRKNGVLNKGQKDVLINNERKDVSAEKERKNFVLDNGRKDVLINRDRKDVPTNKGRKDIALDEGKKGGVIDAGQKGIFSENRKGVFLDESRKNVSNAIGAKNKEITVMVDLFHFEAPLGILGKLFNKLVLTKYMTNFLKVRNAAIKSEAEKRSLSQ